MCDQAIHDYGPGVAEDAFRHADQAGGFWLLRTAPWLSFGALLLLAGWRGVKHGRLAWRWLTTPNDADERWWQIGYTVLWLAT